MTPLDLLARADGLRAHRTPFVLATVVRAERPTSAKPGDRAIILADGTVEGFVGGACAESTVRLQSLTLLSTGASTLLRVTPDGGGERQPPVEGMILVDNPCLSGGTIDIFLEAVLPAPLVHVFGETPIARALAQVGAAAGYAVERHTDANTPIPPDAIAVVVASQGHDEEAVLRAAVAADVPYVALVASRKRGAGVLAETDLPPDMGGRVHSPAGLDLGARTPGDVAVSVLAELVQVRATVPTVVAERTASPGSSTERTASAGTSTGRTTSGGTLTEPVASAETLAAPPLSDGAQTVRLPVGPATAVDPVCSMTVALSPTSLRLEHGGRTWYFCAAGCRSAFTADPGRYGG